jgi:hypothetical protein
VIEEVKKDLERLKVKFQEFLE